jgi:hypothetical protein
MNRFSRSHAQTTGGFCLPMASIAAGGAALGIGLWLEPRLVWANLLLTTFLLVGFSLSGHLFLVLHYLTGARWSNPLRRVAAAIASTLPFTALALGIVVLAGLDNYPWMHEDYSHRSTMWFKAAWLSREFFAARTVAYLVLWTALGWFLLRSARRSETDTAAAANGKNAQSTRRSALFLVVFAVTFWLASVDWIMSLEPEWYSTIFGVYHFAGVLLGGLALITLLTVRLRRGPLAKAIGRPHLHDLGTLLFGFSSFWMYIWFCQYMLIWYTNIPEETVYFAARTRGAWGPLFVLNFLLNWAVPFVVLLPKAAKHSEKVLINIAIAVLCGRWLDMYLGVVPVFSPEGPSVGWSALGALALAGGVGAMLLSRSLQAALRFQPAAASIAFEGVTSRQFGLRDESRTPAGAYSDHWASDNRPTDATEPVERR